MVLIVLGGSYSYLALTSLFPHCVRVGRSYLVFNPDKAHREEQKARCFRQMLLEQGDGRLSHSDNLQTQVVPAEHPSSLAVTN